MVWAGVGAVLMLLYPAVVYVILTRFEGRAGVLGLLALATVVALLRLRSSVPGKRLRVLGVPAALSLVALASLFLDDHRFMLALPVLINAALLFTFGSTLRVGPPLVERFARMQVQDLRPEEVRYCRTVTAIWSGFFVVNGLTAGLLAWRAPVAWWALYTGLIAYVLIGLLGAGEYIVRKYRFGRFGSGLHDRLLAALLPTAARSAESAK